MKLSNLKTGLLLELKIAPSSFYFRSAGLHCCISPRLFRSIFSRKHQLRILDCTQCDWVTDDSIQIVAKNFPFMESLTLAKCRFHGKSMFMTLNLHKSPQLLLLSIWLERSTPRIYFLNVLRLVKFLSSLLTTNQMKGPW